MKNTLKISVILALAVAANTVSAGQRNGALGSDFFTKPAGKVTTLRAAGAKVASYACKEVPALRVHYFFIKGTPAALVPVRGKEVLFVRIAAASGERYASGTYVWWTKGEQAFLEDTATPNTFVYSHCEQQFITG